MNATRNDLDLTSRTNVERKSGRELVITRTFNGPARLVFEAWTKPELLKLWWAPRSVGVSLLSCEADVRAGGKYRFEIGREGSKPMVFFGQYVEVIPHSRLVWTNEESEDGAVTTVTFEDQGRIQQEFHGLFAIFWAANVRAPLCGKVHRSRAIAGRTVAGARLSPSPHRYGIH